MTTATFTVQPGQYPGEPAYVVVAGCDRDATRTVRFGSPSRAVAQAHATILTALAAVEHPLYAGAT